jgi:hypothetical protein
MNEQAMGEVLEGFLPGRAVLFIAKDGQRMVLAVTGPVEAIIVEYERAGYSVEIRPELRKAS